MIFFCSCLLAKAAAAVSYAALLGYQSSVGGVGSRGGGVKEFVLCLLQSKLVAERLRARACRFQRRIS